MRAIGFPGGGGVVSVGDGEGELIWRDGPANIEREVERHDGSPRHMLEEGGVPPGGCPLDKVGGKDEVLQIHLWRDHRGDHWGCSIHQSDSPMDDPPGDFVWPDQADGIPGHCDWVGGVVEQADAQGADVVADRHEIELEGHISRDPEDLVDFPRGEWIEKPKPDGSLWNRGARCEEKGETENTREFGHAQHIPFRRIENGIMASVSSTPAMRRVSSAMTRSHVALAKAWENVVPLGQVE